MSVRELLIRPLPLVVACLIAPPLQGQWSRPHYSTSLRVDPAAAPAAASAVSGPRSTGRLVLGGTLGAAAGLGVALATYTALDRQNPCLASDCDTRLGTGLIAATAGVTLATPLGVHLADGRRGSLLKGLLVSAGVAGLGWAGAALADDARWLLLVPPAQIAGTVVTERATAR